jgi:hypothetical protein
VDASTRESYSLDVVVFLPVVLQSRPLFASDSHACERLLFRIFRQYVASGMMEEGATENRGTADPSPMLSWCTAGVLRES